MKAVFSILVFLLFLVLLLYPAGSVLCACLGYSLILTNIPVFAMFTGLLSLGICIFPRKGISSVIQPFLLPLSLLHSFFCILASGTLFVLLDSLLCVICCGYLSFQCKRPFLQNAAWILSGFLVPVLVFVGFLSLVFGSLGHNEVVKTLESPKGNYCARVIASDQGALGGNTWVEVSSRDIVCNWLFRITKKPQRIYSGPWSQRCTLEISWQSETVLIIHSTPYPIT